jgi:hypothetical protein
MRDCGKDPAGFFAYHTIHDVKSSIPQNALIPPWQKKEWTWKVSGAVRAVQGK